jgi:hypothetical protein
LPPAFVAGGWPGSLVGRRGLLQFSTLLAKRTRTRVDFPAMSSHLLSPATGKPYLCPQEVIRRLGYEFDYCNTIEENAVFPIEKSYHVMIADGEASPVRLTFRVHADEGLLIEYFSSQHELETCLLRKRCATVLEYESIRV